MYATCLFCAQSLDTNAAIEHFPVGRRLAFDAADGRLWVVCRACGRWNLTPLEERWEAIEECERAFRDTRVRASTDNIGLARLREGTELVRVGRPLRPEFAAWRYGDQFGHRRRQALLRLGAGAVAGTALVVGGALAGVFTGGTFVLAYLARGRIAQAAAQRRVARLVIDGMPTTISRAQMENIRLGALHGSRAPTLQVPHARGTHRVSGAEIDRVLGRLLPQLNHMGATPRQVRAAVDELEDAPDPRDYLATAVQRATRLGITALPDFPYEVRLALEMAAHEEAERRALAGELAALEAAWREADEIARIADALTVSPAIEARLREMK